MSAARRISPPAADAGATPRFPAIVAAVAVTAVALGLRVAFLAETAGGVQYLVPAPELDVQVYWEAARALRGVVAGATSLELRWVSAPLYPIVLALQQTIFGENLTTQRLVSAVLGSLRFLPLTWALHRLTGRLAAATAAALLVAVLPSTIVFDTMLLKAGLDLTLLTLLLYVVARASSTTDDRSIRRAGLLAGAILCLGYLSQSATLLFVLGVAGFAFFHPAWSRSGKRAFAGLAAAGLLVGVVGCAIFQRTAGWPYYHDGFNMRLGFQSHELAVYLNPLTPPTLSGHAFTARMLAELEAGRPLTPSQADRHHRSQAIRFAKEHPDATARIVGRKLLLAMNDYEARGEVYIPAAKADSKLLRMDPVGFGWLVVLSPLGVAAWLGRAYRARLAFAVGLILAVGAPLLASFVTCRFRLPAVLPLTALAAAGLAWGWDGIRARSWAKLAAVAPFVAVLAWVGYQEPPGVPKRGGLDSERAFIAFSATAADTERELATLVAAPPTPENRRERSDCLTRLGRHSQSLEMLDALIAQGSTDPQVWTRWGTYRIWMGDYEGFARSLAAIDATSPSLAREVIGRLRYPSTRDAAMTARILERFVLPRLPRRLTS